MRRPLWLIVLLICGKLCAQEAGPTLSELLKRASAEEQEGFDDLAPMMRWHLSYHAGPKWGNHQHLLVISWFHRNARMVLRYTVTDKGVSDNVRFVYNHASQDYHDEQLSAEKMLLLREQMLKLPASKAEPPIERTVHVSFQSGDKWRTETYDAADLPDEMEKVMEILGERFETRKRREIAQ